MNLKAKAAKLKTDLPAVCLALKKKETPPAAKLLAGLTMVYALSPIDLIPDFIPVLGALDDLLLLPAFIALTVRLIPPDVLDRCRREAEELHTEKGPKKWIYAVPIAVFWLFVIFLIVKAVLW